MTAVLTALANFNGASGQFPNAGLIADAAGNLFGTTATGGAYGYGAVFELVNNGAGGYTPVTLLSFSSTPGVAGSDSGVIADAAGNLFGTIPSGGANGDGAVFELVNHGGAYTQVTLRSFNGANGALPFAGLIADAAGNLFGTTASGGANGDGTVFEIAKTGAGYASTPTTLFSFDGANGTGPDSRLVADAAGDLFGTTPSGGANGYGAVFELVNSGGSIHAGHAAQLQRRRQRGVCRPLDHRRRRRSIRHDGTRRGGRHGHGVRARKQRRRLHAGHAAQLQLRRRGWGVSGRRSDR